MNAVGSVSIIRNFMGNAGRNVCNEYLYEALKDADDALQKQIPKRVIKTKRCSQACPECKCAVNGNFCSNCGQRLSFEL